MDRPDKPGDDERSGANFCKVLAFAGHYKAGERVGNQASGINLINSSEQIAKCLRRLGVDLMIVLLGGAKTLFHFVISLSFAAALAGALLAVKLVGGAVRFYLLGLPLGLLIGLVSSYASLRAVRATGSRHPRMLFAGAAVWAIVSASISNEITRLALAAVF